MYVNISPEFGEHALITLEDYRRLAADRLACTRFEARPWGIDRFEIQHASLPPVEQRTPDLPTITVNGEIRLLTGRTATRVAVPAVKWFLNEENVQPLQALSVPELSRLTGLALQDIEAGLEADPFRIARLLAALHEVVKRAAKPVRLLEGDRHGRLYHDGQIIAYDEDINAVWLDLLAGIGVPVEVDYNLDYDDQEPGQMPDNPAVSRPSAGV